MHRYTNNGTVRESLREFRNKAANLRDNLRETTAELSGVESALDYVTDAVGSENVEEIAGAKFDIAQTTLKLEADVENFQRLIETAKRIAGGRFLKEAAKPITLQNF